MKLITNFLLVCTLLVAGCGQSGAQAGDGIAKTLTVQEYETTLAAKLTQANLVDVRTPDEYTSGHLAGAQNIDFYDESFKDRMAKLDKTKPVFIYCKSGGRSGKALNQLTAMGFTEVYNLNGGINEWLSAHKAVTTAK